MVYAKLELSAERECRHYIRFLFARTLLLQNLEKVSREDAGRSFEKPPLEGIGTNNQNIIFITRGNILTTQHNRNEADYNLLKEWQPLQVSLLVEGVADAFKRRR